MYRHFSLFVTEPFYVKGERRTTFENACQTLVPCFEQANILNSSNLLVETGSRAMKPRTDLTGVWVCTAAYTNERLIGTNGTHSCVRANRQVY